MLILSDIVFRLRISFYRLLYNYDFYNSINWAYLSDLLVLKVS